MRRTRFRALVIYGSEATIFRRVATRHCPANTFADNSRMYSAAILRFRVFSRVSVIVSVLEKGPTKPERIKQPSLFIFDKVRSGLMNQQGGHDLDFVKLYKSGRRRYMCRSFRLECSENGKPHYWIGILLERYSSGVAAVTELSKHFDLTCRERETVEFLLQGLTSKEIAERMKISPNTVKAFLRLVMVKMEVSTRSGIVGKIVASE